MKKAATSVLLSWTLLSGILGPGIGRGVSQDFAPLPQEQYYQFNENTKLEYDNAIEAKRSAVRKNERLFDNFYQREMKHHK